MELSVSLIVIATLLPGLLSAPIVDNVEYVVDIVQSSPQQLQLHFNNHHLMVNLTATKLFYTDHITDNRITGTDKHYMQGAVYSEPLQEPVGWASLLLSLDAITSGILTVNGATYQLLYSVDDSLHKLKLIGTDQNLARNGPLRIKRHDHVIKNATIEVAIVIDEVMMEFHNHTISTYLQNIMNTVSHLFRHPSLESIVRIAVTDIVILKDNELNLSGDEDSETLRDDFCKWRAGKVVGDIAVLLTRRNICESKGSCGILGITNPKSMCQKDSKSCPVAVVKDTGYSTAFTITHEIGHSLGLQHDGDKNNNVNCNSDKHYIMAASFEDSINPHVWSTCSKQQIHKFFSSPQSHCLNNSPSLVKEVVDIDAVLIGRNYSLDTQCSLLFGRGAKACFKTNCSILWCSVDEGTTCDKTQHSPPLAGSPCSLGNQDESTVCYHGECINSDSVITFHGQWSEWGSWSQCTFSCGTGVQYSHRQCNSPTPQFSGKYCKGARERYRTCNNNPCPSQEKSYRDKQCEILGQEYDKNRVQAQQHDEDQKWRSVDEKDIAHHGQHPCNLYCKKKPSDFILLKDTVSNGVSCYTNHHFERGVCIEGKCLKVGCGNSLNTPTYTDACGVECGDNSSCVVINDTFTAQGQPGDLIKMITIPAQSKDIVIDGNINTPVNHVGHDKWGHDKVVNISDTSEDHVVVSGAVFWFTANNLHAVGPLTSDVQIKVYFRMKATASWTYSFKAPSNYSKCKYEWIVDSEWSECSTQCGQGIQHRSVVCKQSCGLTTTYAENSCQDLTKPATTQTCNKGTCKWYSTNWTMCSTGCGSGHKERSVVCKNMNTSQHVDEEYCMARVRPDERATCNSSVDCPRWVVISEWSQCSVSCGQGGVQSRTVQCLFANGTLSANCDQSKKPLYERPCQQQPDCVKECSDSNGPWCTTMKKSGLCGLFKPACCKSCST